MSKIMMVLKLDFGFFDMIYNIKKVAKLSKSYSLNAIPRYNIPVDCLIKQFVKQNNGLKFSGIFLVIYKRS